MFCYFLCLIPCGVKVNGEYVGKASKNLTFIELSEGLIEFIPLSNSHLQTTYYFDENNPRSTQNIKIIDLYGGFLLIPSFSKRCDGEFKMIGRKEFNFSKETSLSCYSQNGIKLCVNYGNDVFIESIPFLPEDVRFETARSHGEEYLIAICVGKRTLIVGFHLGERITLAFKNICDGYSFERNTLTILENKNTLLKHSISSVWQFAEKVTLVKYAVQRKKELFTLHEKLIPYAFLEEVRLSGNIADFLTPRLKPRASEIKEFLGKFTDFFPSPHFKPDDYITLLYENSVSYLKLTMQNGLIDNIILLDKE